MKGTIWLRVSAKKSGLGWQMGQTEILKKKPDCGPKQVALELKLDVPDAFFEKPHLTANICIPDGNVMMPPKLDVNVTEDLQKMLSKKFGLDVTVTVG